MADKRYLKKRREGWYFSIAVPTALRGKFGQTKKTGANISQIVLSLKTRDLDVAQQARWPFVHKYQQAFERAGTGEPLSEADIDEQAAECFTSTLERLEADAKRGIRVEAEPQRDESREVAGLRIHHNLYGSAFEEDNFEIIADEIAAAQRRTGVTINPTEPVYQLLASALLHAKVTALQTRIKALEGISSESPATFLLSGGINPVTGKSIKNERSAAPIRGRDPSSIRFSEAAALYLDERQRDKSAALTEQTRQQSETVFRLFQEFTKDAPISAITRSTASDFLTSVAKLHPKWGRRAQKCSLESLLRKYGQGKEQLTNKTLNRYSSALSSVFKWARNAGKFDKENPFREQSRPLSKKSSGWLAYNDEELNTLFHSSLFTGTTKEQRIRPAKHTLNSAKLWIPLIALYSGMRLGEICQLQTSDVKQDEQNILFFDVNEETEGQSVKTIAGIRRVTVHSMLIRCGFREYLNGLPSGRLFPALKPAGPDNRMVAYFSRRFSEFRREVGIVRPQVSFHSFRKNVATVLDNAGVSRGDIAALIGHERGFTLDTYSGGKRLKALQAITEMIEYPNVKLDHLFLK